MNPTETLPPSSSPLENTDDGISVQAVSYTHLTLPTKA